MFGTRPEAIKLAPVIAALRARPELEPIVCVTAQHRVLLDQVLRFFSIHPDVDLDLMQDGQTLSGFAARALEAVGSWLDGERLSGVIVQGDTTTAFMAALAAYHRRIPVIHVEAGLRTHDRYEPFPEEGNRRLTAAIAELNFAPTDVAARNLLAEGIDPSRIHITGNTVVDAVMHVRDLAKRGGLASPVLVPPGDRLLTATVHRRENFGEPLRRICSAFRSLVRRRDGIHVALPVHPNPSVRPVVHEELGGEPRISLIDPPAYPDFVGLMMASYLILTDSGGIQEEAPALGKPTLVLRRVTERVSGIEEGAARVVGDSEDAIVPEVERLLDDEAYYTEFAKVRLPYGDGNASRRIAGILADSL